ncbi:hypothetical protein CFP56_001136 [Quercus suber]|uniref:Uncharacterized protein n=1 Tax=Quercus suber TaxID=58331 RepID=A0AAW0IM58_QUESU
MSGGYDQMGRGPVPGQPRPVPERQVQPVNGDNRGGADRRSLLHGLLLDLRPPLLSGVVQFEQRPNEKKKKKPTTRVGIHDPTPTSVLSDPTHSLGKRQRNFLIGPHTLSLDSHASSLSLFHI